MLSGYNLGLQEAKSAAAPMQHQAEIKKLQRQLERVEQDLTRKTQECEEQEERIKQVAVTRFLRIFFARLTKYDTPLVVAAHPRSHFMQQSSRLWRQFQGNTLIL